MDPFYLYLSGVIVGGVAVGASLFGGDADGDGLADGMRALAFVLLMYVAADISLLFTFAVLFGLVDLATVPVTVSLVVSHLGRRIMGLAMGLIAGGHALGAAAGAYAGGVLFDLFSRYDWVWIVSLALSVSAALISLTIRETRGAAGQPAAEAA